MAIKIPWDLAARPALAILALSIVITQLTGLMGIGPSAKTVFIDGERRMLPSGYWMGGGHSKIPVVGDNMDFLMSQFKFLDDRYAQFGNVSKTWLFGKPTYVLAGADGMKRFYDSKHVHRADPYPWFFKRVLGGHSILNMIDDPTFTERRTNIEKAAGFRDPATLDHYLAEVSDTLEGYIRKWAAQPVGKTLLGVRETHLASAEIAARIFLGFDHVGAGQVAPQIVSWASATLNGAQAPPIPVPGTSFWKGSRAGDKALAFILDRLRAHTNHSLAWNRPYPHALGILAKRLQPGLFRPGLRHDTEEGVATEAYHMVIAMEALVGNALADTLMVLHEHPEVYDKVKQEVLTTLGSDRARLLTTAQLAKLPYCRGVVDEVRRLFPFVAGMLGSVHKGFDVTSRGRNVHVPANSTVVGAFYLTQHSPEEWSDPWAFKPERFAAGSEPRSGTGWAWTPHGAPKGRHFCPGVDLATNTMLAFLVQLARDGCSWEVPPGQASAQRLTLFNPEPVSGVKLRNWHCRAYPRPETMDTQTGSPVTADAGPDVMP